MNVNSLNRLRPCLEGVNFGFEKHQLTNSYDQFIIDSASGCIYILDDVSCNAKRFSIKVFGQDLKYQSSFEIPENLHSMTQDKGYACFGVNKEFIYFLNRTTLSIISKTNFQMITCSTVNSPNDAWNRILVGEHDSICLYRTKHVPCKSRRLEILVLTDFKYSIKRRFDPENYNLSLVYMTDSSVLLMQENLTQHATHLLEVSYDGVSIQSMNLGDTDEILAFSIGPLYTILLTANSALNIFTRTGGKVKNKICLELSQTEETSKMIYNIDFDENTNALFVYSPFYLSRMFVKFQLTI